MNENLTTEESKEIPISSQKSVVPDLAGIKTLKRILLVTLSLFAISSLSTLLLRYTGHTPPGGVSLWYVAAACGIASFLSFFIWGFVKFCKGSGARLMRSALLFLVVVLLVGAGTCYINMFGLKLF